MTMKQVRNQPEAAGGLSSTSGASSPAQPFLGFDPAELVAVRVRPAEFARLSGVTKQAVSGWIKRGLVTLGPDGRLDPSKAYRELMANGDPAKLRARFMKGAMDDVGKLKAEVLALRQQVAAQEAARAYWLSDEEVEARLSRLLQAIEDKWPAIVQCQQSGDLAAALDWIAGRAFRGLTADELAEGLEPESEGLPTVLECAASHQKAA